LSLNINVIAVIDIINNIVESKYSITTFSTRGEKQPTNVGGAEKFQHIKRTG
jgi:hypothetical protein